MPARPIIKRCLALLIALLMPLIGGQAEGTAIPYPPLDAQGYLLDDSPGAEFIHKDAEAGLWSYVSNSLRVDIRRHQDKVGRRQTTWFVADIHAREGQLLRSYSHAPENPGSKRSRPESIAQQHSVVYAQNGDLWTWRLDQGRYPGVIIRDGVLLRDRSYRKAVTAIPSLDELSLYPDGRMEVRHPSEMTSGEYLERGAHDVFAFGPILIRDGQVDARIVGNFRTGEPRSAIGMVAPGHYIGLVVEGRTSRSNGSGLEFLAQQLLNRGCSLAFNLDGGQTASMVFMGESILRDDAGKGDSYTRKQPDILGIGTSPAVKKPDE